MRRAKNTLFLAISLCLLIPYSSYAQDLYISPGLTDISVDSSFAVEVLVQNVTDLSAFEFCISFDASILQVAPDGLTRGTLWDNPNYLWHAGVIDNVSGVIAFTSGAASSALSPVGVNDCALANITFQTIAEGTSSINLTDVFMCYASGNVIDANIINGSVQVNPPSADLEVSKTVSDTTPNEGDAITYTITLTNNGPDPATGIQITDPMPSGVAYASDTGQWITNQ